MSCLLLVAMTSAGRRSAREMAGAEAVTAKHALVARAPRNCHERRIGRQRAAARRPAERRATAGGGEAARGATGDSGAAPRRPAERRVPRRPIGGEAADGYPRAVRALVVT